MIMNTLLNFTIMKPTTKIYSYTARNLTKFVKRTAKFAPQLLADGLTNGVVSDQGNLVHGMFDEDGSSVVDDYCNIASDKFEIMNKSLNPSPSSYSSNDTTVSDTSDDVSSVSE